jgi:lysophospholipase L1-like esterase
LINSFLTGLSPEKEIMVINKGVNGNTILDLPKRWQKDVLDLKPDWVSIMIGVNDVWRQFDAVMQPIEQVSEKQFSETYEDLIRRTMPNVSGMIIISPFMICAPNTDPMRERLDVYSAIAQKISQKHGLVYIDVQSKMDEFLKHQSSYILSADRVHVNLSGHMIIAKAFLDGIGFSGN